jgi:hypothetical protein
MEVKPFLCNNMLGVWAWRKKSDQSYLLSKNSLQFVISYHANEWLTNLKYLSWLWQLWGSRYGDCKQEYRGSNLGQITRCASWCSVFNCCKIQYIFVWPSHTISLSFLFLSFFLSLFLSFFYNNWYKLEGSQSATASYKCEIKTGQRILRKVRGSCFDWGRTL